MTSKIIIGIVAVIILAAGTYFVVTRNKQLENDGILTFEDCTAAGYPVMEIFPEQCRTPDGRIFVREVVTPITTPTGCTQEAKICPDGSSVGRIDPNCEFARCPGE